MIGISQCPVKKIIMLKKGVNYGVNEEYESNGQNV